MIEQTNQGIFIISFNLHLNNMGDKKGWVEEGHTREQFEVLIWSWWKLSLKVLYGFKAKKAGPEKK